MVEKIIILKLFCFFVDKALLFNLLYKKKINYTMTQELGFGTIYLSYGQVEKYDPLNPNHASLKEHDMPLTDEGKKQVAETIQDIIKRTKQYPTIIISSNYRRGRDAAEIAHKEVIALHKKYHGKKPHLPPSPSVIDLKSKNKTLHSSSTEVNLIDDSSVVLSTNKSIQKDKNEEEDKNEVEEDTIWDSDDNDENTIRCKTKKEGTNGSSLNGKQPIATNKSQDDKNEYKVTLFYSSLLGKYYNSNEQERIRSPQLDSKTLQDPPPFKESYEQFRIRVSTQLSVYSYNAFEIGKRLALSMYNKRQVLNFLNNIETKAPVWIITHPEFIREIAHTIGMPSSMARNTWIHPKSKTCNWSLAQYNGNPTSNSPYNNSNNNAIVNQGFNNNNNNNANNNNNPSSTYYPPSHQNDGSQKYPQPFQNQNHISNPLNQQISQQQQHLHQHIPQQQQQQHIPQPQQQQSQQQHQPPHQQSYYQQQQPYYNNSPNNNIANYNNNGNNPGNNMDNNFVSSNFLDSLIKPIKGITQYYQENF